MNSSTPLAVVAGKENFYPTKVRITTTTWLRELTCWKVRCIFRIRCYFLFLDGHLKTEFYYVTNDASCAAAFPPNIMKSLNLSDDEVHTHTHLLKKEGGGGGRRLGPCLKEQ